jgi:hypothetical protein
MVDQPKFNIGQNVIIIDVSSSFIESEITGYIKIKRGDNLNYKEEFVYTVKEIEANTDELYTDILIKLYHESCIYSNYLDISERGLPIKPSLKSDYKKIFKK